MKKASVFIALLAFVCGRAFAQEVLVSDSFEDYTVGGKVAQQAVAMGRDYLTTWNNNPGSSEDPTVVDTYASDGSQSIYIGSTSNDVVVLLGGHETGVYEVTMDLYFEEGRSGYFNLMHNFAGSGSKWAMQAYFHLSNNGSSSTSTPGQGVVFAGCTPPEAPSFTCYYNEWMHIKVFVDTDNDLAAFYVNDELIRTWQWSLNSFGEQVVNSKLDGMDFYSPTSSSLFYIDNVKLTRIDETIKPVITLDQDEIYKEVEAGSTDVASVTIANEGNSIGNWYGYVDFGQGQGGSAQQDLKYDNGLACNLTGLAFNNLIEIANKFPVSTYANAFLGTKLKGVKYFALRDDYQYLGFSGDLTLRAYRANADGLPGELLGEAVIPRDQLVMDNWNTAYFEEEIWLTGYDVFVAAEFMQADYGYPVVFDNGNAVPDTRYLRLNAGAWYHVEDVWQDYYNNFCLRAVCEGTPLTDGNWATVDKNGGQLAGGMDEQITLTFNTVCMNNGEEHHAHLYIETNDAENPVLNIPITLKVGVDGVVECSEKYGIYPNPATSVVTLEGENLNSVAIYNAAGQLVRVVRLDNVVNSIEMNVEAGVYFFNIYDNNGNSHVQRVVIQR